MGKSLTAVLELATGVRHKEEGTRLYNIALIQNQSEMSHYGYADARPLIQGLGPYTVDLYTAQNIDELPNDLERGNLHAVVLASNALNDKTIREAVLGQPFTQRIGGFLAKGHGCLVLHQLRLAQTKTALQFLPTPLKTVLPEPREENEKASDGNLKLTGIASDHVGFLYPNRISIDDVKSQCQSFRSLRGLYWHYWTGISMADWNLLVYDTDKKGNERPLVAVSRESYPCRVVLCSLSLDWQKHTGFLGNLLTYVVQGRHYAAIVKEPNSTSASFEYFLDCLRAQEYPFREYNIGQNLHDLVGFIDSGVHKILIMDPFVREKKLGAELYENLKTRVLDGRLKIIGLDREPEVSRFYVEGRERYALRFLDEIEIKVQNELRRGFIDGSFWSTVESLQILREIPYISSRYSQSYSQSTLKEIFKLSDQHDRGGSYDEVFGVSCAFLWLRATHLGGNHEKTQKTLSWLREKLPDYEDRERTLAYNTLIDTGLANQLDQEELKRILLAQQVANLSEIDLIVYLRAAIAAKVGDVLIPMAQRLQSLNRDGCWVDLATSAAAATSLLDVLMLLKEQNTDSYERTRKFVEPLVLKTIIYIQNSRAHVPVLSAEYPWDNKVATSLRCIQAWLRFEESIEMPVHEVIDALKIYTGVEVSKSSAVTALTILEDLKNENRKLVGQNTSLSTEKTRLSAEADKSRSRLKQNIVLASLIFPTLYAAFSFAIASIVLGVDKPLGEIARSAFVSAWPFHTAFLTLIATLVMGLKWWERRRQ